MPSQWTPRLQNITFTTVLLVGTSNVSMAQFPDFYGENYKRSMAFYENQGQKRNALGNNETSIFYCTENSTPELDLRDRSTVSVVWSEFDETDGEPVLLATNRIDMRPIGELAADVDPVGIDQAPDHLNSYSEYFPTGLTNIPGYQRVRYENVYPGIDMEAYSGHAGAKLAFHCAVGSNPANITLNFAGQDSVGIDMNGALRVYLGQRWVQLREAVAYQYDGNDIIPVNWTASYIHNSGSANVRLQYDTYNPALPLVFLIGQDGLLGGGGNTAGILWSSYYSGNGWDELYAVDHDASGSIYAGGYTYTGLFPVTVGSSTNPGSYTGTLVKFNSSHQRIWATMYGGSNADEVKSLVYSASSGSVYATGYTQSSDFPLVYAAGAYNYTGGFSQRAPYILKINGTTGVANWATRFGSGVGLSIALGPNGSKYIVGLAPEAGLPVVPQAGSYNQAYGGGAYDGVLCKFSITDQLVWSTYVGAAGDDEYLEGVCVDGAGTVYALGMTNSGNFPIVNPGGGAFQQTNNAGGGTDLVILRFSPTGLLSYSSYYGGNGSDTSPDHDCIQVAGGRVIISGWTTSSNFPVLSYPGAFNDGSYDGGSSGDGFIIVLNSSTMSRSYATYLGGTGSDACYGTSMDTDGNAYVVGYSGSGIPLAGQAGLYNDDTYQGGGCFIVGPSDAFIMRLDAGTLALSWSTYFGGSGCDAFWGVDAFENTRLAVVGVSGNSSDRPFFDPGNEAWFASGTSGTHQSTIAELNILDSEVGFAEPSVSGLTVYPNPAAHAVLLGGLEGKASVEICDALGRTCIERSLSFGTESHVALDLSGLVEGYYLVRVWNDSGLYGTSRLVVQYE